MKFNVGTKVRVRTDLPYDVNGRPGAVYTIKAVYSDGYYVRENPFFWIEDMFEDDAVPRERFKVGDAVKVLRDGTWHRAFVLRYHPYSHDCWFVKLDQRPGGSTFWVADALIEAVDPKPAEKIENSDDERALLAALKNPVAINKLNKDILKEFSFYNNKLNKSILEKSSFDELEKLTADDVNSMNNSEKTPNVSSYPTKTVTCVLSRLSEFTPGKKYEFDGRLVFFGNHFGLGLVRRDGASRYYIGDPGDPIAVFVALN